ncbi:hypothetical protein J7T55_013520 [Diaporthe amygdali]|uniref:uncharacterized protein n=1 Tax=Phomopsis amygdali TaxID=1214568 RepID=UPI0022FF1913|nr:uncharacterized protein J7T55_013520 [Diaporthe amygdali]KAJ0119283.1 hypothetical protein J7T55_013520 [Diaporthe amygdali]
MQRARRRSSASAPAPGPGAVNANATVPPTPTGFNFSFFTGPNYAPNPASSNNIAPSSRARPGTSSGAPPISAGIGGFANTTANNGDQFQGQAASAPSGPNLLRKNSLRGKQSFDNLVSYSSQQQSQSIFRGLRRRANSSSSLRDRDGVGAALGVVATGQKPVLTNRGNPPALPDFALSAAAKLSRETDVFTSPSSAAKTSMDISGGYIQTSNSRMLSRSGTTPVNGFPSGGGMMPPPQSAGGMQNESNMVHQHIHEMANKRISTLEYLRKAHEGRVYWFNTLLFDKPDLARMPYFDARRLARRATNYLLLGLSLPTVIDLNSSTPMEFLRAFNVLLTEFDSFQQLHSDTGSTSSSLSRARIPQMFRRATPSSKVRRSSSANNEILYEAGDGGISSTNGGSISGQSASNGALTVGNGLGGSASVVSFGQSEADLLPGEEYVHLLTPSLPFDPDFFETFATLCDVLIDAYARLLSLLPTPRECNAAVAEQFTKADSRVRKIIVQGIVKEFEDTSRNGVKTEVANVGKIVLGGLM